MKKIALNIWQKIPYNLRNQLDILRRYPVWKKHKVIFIHIPKTAGVSVNKAIYGRPLGHFYAKDIKKYCPKIFNNMFTFAVVRHPLERLYSAYNFSKKGGTNVMGMYQKDYYVNHPSFITFEKFINEWLIKQDLSKIDGVFRPQYLYIFDDNDQLLVNNFYKLEEIRHHVDEISNKLGKTFSLGFHNSSKKKAINFSDDVKKLIYKIYIKDFELFNYSIK
jgi:hypothetical protein